MQKKLTSSLLVPGLIALALVYGIQLVNEGHLFEGVLLMVVGIFGGVYAEYLLQRWRMSYCDYCGGKMRKDVGGLYYCDRCRRFAPRRA
ncbi:MAG: hypothetical protein QW074_03445 [Candidatus Caldarchaeum sp.]|uniref:Zinc ribbon domain-containing protein n=1 Tax=Caldiarchaeum subterraneum TaxID=311458 RepID=A0A7J3G6T2_CALS0